MSYCDFTAALPENDPNRHYHDQEYGFPVDNDNELFGRLLLEINQAGLNWTLILRKRAAFRAAYSGFDIAAVAAYGEADRQRLLGDAGIVRNRLKIEAAVFNARAVLQLQQTHGSFHRWLHTVCPRDKTAAVRLFKKHFKFVGGEIVGEFLTGIGLLPGAHDDTCPVGRRLAALKTENRPS